MKGPIHHTKRNETHCSIISVNPTVIMLVNILLGIGLASAQTQALRDGGLVSETATLLVSCRDASRF